MMDFVTMLMEHATAKRGGMVLSAIKNAKVVSMVTSVKKNVIVKIVQFVTMLMETVLALKVFKEKG